MRASARWVILEDRLSPEAEVELWGHVQRRPDSRGTDGDLVCSPGQPGMQRWAPGRPGGGPGAPTNLIYPK